MSDIDKTENDVITQTEILQKNKAKEAAVLRYIEEQNTVLHDEPEGSKSAFEKIKELVGGIFGLLMIFIGPFVFNRRGRKELISYLIIKVLIPLLIAYWLASSMFASTPDDNHINSSATTAQINKQ